MTNIFPVFILLAIITVVALTELIKKVDKKNVLKGYRVWIPAILSFFASAALRIGDFFTNPDQVWFYCAVIFAFSTFGYEAVLRKIQNVLNK